jgi:hypothetical protein
MEPIGYERADRNCLLSSPNQFEPEILQFNAGQSEDEIAALIESTVG